MNFFLRLTSRGTFLFQEIGKLGDPREIPSSWIRKIDEGTART
jgi:hypothetical protein